MMSDSKDTTNDARLTRETGRRLVGAIAAFATSEVRGKAAALFATLLGLMLAISGLNVLNSYVGRDFMTAIEHRDRGAAFVERGITCIALGGIDEPRHSFDTVLVLAADGTWHVESVRLGSGSGDPT